MFFGLDAPTIIARVLVLLTAFSVHEFAHAWTANYFGDDTPGRYGRLTLNPLAHLDVMGSLMLIFVGFGWAKPVPVDWRNLRNPKRDMVFVAVAGPMANLVMALFWGLMFKFATLIHDIQFIAVPLGLMAQIGIMINTVLFVFNLFPLPPLIL